MKADVKKIKELLSKIGQPNPNSNRSKKALILTILRECKFDPEDVLKKLLKIAPKGELIAVYMESEWGRTLPLPPMPESEFMRKRFSLL